RFVPRQRRGRTEGMEPSATHSERKPAHWKRGRNLVAEIVTDNRTDRTAVHSGTPYRVVSRPVPPMSGTNVPRCPVRVLRSGRLLPPSPPAEQATACQDQAGQASTRDGAGDRPFLRLSFGLD